MNVSATVTVDPAGILEVRPTLTVYWQFPPLAGVQFSGLTCVLLTCTKQDAGRFDPVHGGGGCT